MMKCKKQKIHENDENDENSELIIAGIIANYSIDAS